ncbi:ArnT family glycosyltransferase [Pendulispora albinea]|uniref:Glycosyltransferase family 39 protein n=1 Tax=Pendulispora albinea TaxID=2741071 RepID=A0ABZ2LRM1_9BACT
MTFLRPEVRRGWRATFNAERLAQWGRSPLTWILVACALVRVVGIGWGLPASDGWDNDGVAPRDFLAGLVETFTPGHYFTYPPFHLLVLGLLTSPVTIVALLRAPSLAPPDVIAEILNVSYMTGIAYIARFTTLVMSLGITYAMAKIAEAVRDRRAGYCAAAITGIDVSFTYYGKMTNLDVPYLFWGSLALLALVRAIAWNEPRRLRAFVILAVLAVATKDQAYALFLVGAPLAIGAWFVFDPRAREGARGIVRELGRGLAIGAGLFLVVDAVILNPTGFRARLGFLVGPASQDFANYSNDMTGRLRVIEETARLYASLWPSAFIVLAVGGIVLHLWRKKHEAPSRWVAGLAPLLTGISFTLAFNCIARRVEHRFILPQSLMLAVYAGLAVHAFLFELRGRVARLFAQAALAVAFARGIFLVVNLDANLLLEPRYDAERWMREHFAPGDRVETYGLNVYIPRFPDNVHVTRIGLDPAARRNPMPGFEERQDRFENVEARKPRWIVISEGWAWRYLTPLPKTEEGGVITPSTQIQTRGDPSATSYFHELLDGRRGYRVAHVGEFKSDIWSRVDLHGSTGRPTWILERVQ